MTFLCRILLLVGREGKTHIMPYLSICKVGEGIVGFLLL